MTLQRILAILSAILLVGAVALATLGPPSVPLGQVLLMIDHDLTETLRTGIEQHLAAWMWSDVALPHAGAAGLAGAGLAGTGLRWRGILGGTPQAGGSPPPAQPAVVTIA